MSLKSGGGRARSPGMAEDVICTRVCEEPLLTRGATSTFGVGNPTGANKWVSSFANERGARFAARNDQALTRRSCGDQTESR